MSPKPLIEVFKGTNGLIYKTVYFIARTNVKIPISKIKLNPFYFPIRSETVSEEISELQWCSLKEAKELLNEKKRTILNRLYSMIVSNNWNLGCYK